MKSLLKRDYSKPRLVNTPRILPPALDTRYLLFGIALLCVFGHAVAQVDGTTAAAGPAPIDEVPVISEADITDPMLFRNRILVCGDITTAGTPIAGNASGGGNSGDISISGIPVTATVVNARLFWTVLTDNDQSRRPEDHFLRRQCHQREMVGFAAETPCFSQQNTVAWSADVTSLVADPGNGVYPLSGFPGDNNFAGGDFTEGASLIITYADPSSTAKAVVSYEGLAVTNDPGETLHQTLAGFEAGGTVSATWIPIVGNGQVAGDPDELLGFTGGAGALNFDDSLDGGTSAIAAETCSYLDSVSNTSCYWTTTATMSARP